MKEATCVEDTIFSASHPHLYKKISSRQVFLAFIVALCGFVMISFSYMLGESNDTLSMVSLTVGIIMALFAIYHFFTKRHETVYGPTGSVVRSGSLYMDSAELQHLQQMIKKNDFTSSSRLVFKEGGNGRLDYLVSKDGKFVAMQLFHFVPYTYEAVSERCYYSDDAAATIARCINI